jgi:hypothetical protein
MPFLSGGVDETQRRISCAAVSARDFFVSLTDCAKFFRIGSMKRDIDLLRDILLKVESDRKWDLPEGHTDEEIADHVLQLKEAGLVEAVVTRDRQGIPNSATIIRLTSAGHDFLDATRNQSFWMKTKNYVTKNLPGWTLLIVKDVAERAAKGELHLPQ